MKTLIIIILYVSYCFAFQAQTLIWSEDFNSYADGIIVGANNNTANPAADWTTSGCTTCPGDPADWWEVRSGVMEARDVNDEHVSLLSEVISITGYAAVYFQVDCNESGDHEGLYQGADDCVDGLNQDYADIEYRIDGGAWTLIQNHLGWCGLYASCGTHTFYGDDGLSGDCRTTDDDWENQTVQILGLSGLTLQLRLSATNSSGTEYIEFDNITVVGYNPLPIELTQFQALQNGNTIELNWSTSNELNNESFTIERTASGFDWEEIHTEAGAGNSNYEVNYFTIDNRPIFGVSYYRLRQTDFDGNLSYSEIQSIDFNSTDLNIGMFPNPANQSIRFNGAQLKGADVIICNEFGQVCLEIQDIDSAERTIEIGQLSNGIYHVQLNNEGQKVTKKLVVLH